MAKVLKSNKKEMIRKLKDDNHKYVTWVRELVNIVYNSDIAVKELLESAGDTSKVDMERVKQLQGVYKEVIDTFTYDSEEESGEATK